MLKHILIADDSETAREINKQCTQIAIQEQFDLEFHFCKNGQEALDLIHQIRMDLIISDNLMPVMTGEELAKQLHQLPILSQIPMIMVSSKVDDDTLNFVSENGVYYVIRKPVSPIKMREALESIHFIQTETFT